MDLEFKDCLARGSIKELKGAVRFVAKELKAAEDDLKEARKSLQRESTKWAIVQAYYAMFHAGRALVYKQGYRERSHHCLIVALRALYQGKGLSAELVDRLGQAKALRENADYVGEFSKESSDFLVRSAEEFVKAAHSLLKEGSGEKKRQGQSSKGV